MPPQNQNKPSLKDTLDDERIKDITQKLRPVRREREERSSLINNVVVQEKESPKPEESVAQKQNESLIKPIRTYQSDVAEAVRAKDESVASISLAEKKRAEDRGYIAPKKTGDGGRGIVIALLSLVLIIGGGLAIYVTFIKTEQEEKVVVAPKPKSLISASKETNLNVQNMQSFDLFTEIRRSGELLGVSSGSLGNIKLVKDDEKNINPQDLFDITSWSTPPTLVRSIKDFMIGAYGKELGIEIFIALKTESFEQAFPGMLAWEKSLARDMSVLLDTQGGVFRDGFIKNRDVRIVQNDEGGVSLLYSFLDSNTIVITKSSEAFIAILAQFTTNQLIR